MFFGPLGLYSRSEEGNMGHNSHNSAHPHPAQSTRGTRLDSKLGRRITLGRLIALLKTRILPEGK